MNVVVGFACLVAVVIAAGVTGAPEQQLEIKDQIDDYKEEELERKDPGCGTREACKIAGGRCQALTEECGGELRTDGFYCKGSKKCGCCIPQVSSILFQEEKPYEVYLKLNYRSINLGKIRIVLNGTDINPGGVSHFLLLIMGVNVAEGSYKGAGFDQGIPYGGPGTPGSYLGNSGFMNSSGLQTNLLFPLAYPGHPTSPVVGEVRAMYDKTAGFIIVLQSDPRQESGYAYLGYVSSGLHQLQNLVQMGQEYLEAITFSECGLVD